MPDQSFTRFVSRLSSQEVQMLSGRIAKAVPTWPFDVALPHSQVNAELRLALIAADLAPHLYLARCRLQRLVPEAWDTLSPERRKGWIDQAATMLLDL